MWTWFGSVCFVLSWVSVDSREAFTYILQGCFKHWSNHMIVPVKQPWRIWVKLNGTRPQQQEQHQTQSYPWLLRSVYVQRVQTMGSEQSCFALLVQIWWSWLEQMMSYCTDKLESQNWVKFGFKVKFNSQGQGWLPPETIRTLTRLFCTFGAKFGDPSLNSSRVITWTNSWLTHGRMDGHIYTYTKRCRRRQYTKAKTGLG